MISQNKPIPFISIVIPTRDRPGLLDICLKAISKQNFNNYEVIVCDNYVNESCKDVMASYENDPRFKYFTPDEPLPMCDNWDFAVSKATGEYVSVISEKYLLRSDALEILHKAIQNNPAELVSWWHETYTVMPTSSPQLPGKYVPILKPKSSSYFDPIDIIKLRMSFRYRPYSRQFGPMENLGKIYSGCFHRKLLAKIDAQYGRIFPLTSPDTTSMMAGLSLADSCLDLGQPLVLVCSSTELSNGYKCSINTTINDQYFKQLGYEGASVFRATMPLKNIWAGASMFISRDYEYIKSKTQNIHFKHLEINKVNLLINIKKELDIIQVWTSEEEKETMTNAWQTYVDDCSYKDKQYIFDMLKNKNDSQPNTQEISFAGGVETDICEHAISAKNRAKLNWTENKVFRIKDEYLRYDNVETALDYFSDYYKESAYLLKL